jgi:hypothetical protein
MARQAGDDRNHAEASKPVAYSDLIRATAQRTRKESCKEPARHDADFMTLLSSARNGAHRWRKPRHGHLIAVAMSGVILTGAVALVAYLLWPTWGADASKDPGRLPVSVGATLFNVPTDAFRMKVQKHSGPQERIDLSFLYPSLTAPDGVRHVSADSVEEAIAPIDRIFLSISAHYDAMAPDIRLRTIYPRYLDPASSPAQDGLSVRAFRDGSPYSNEDLFFADTPNMVARCSRDVLTPGMCLSERRIGGADLTFRFPRAWMAQWRDVAGAIDQLTAQLTSPRG